jgi:hypothetical protein
MISISKYDIKYKDALKKMLLMENLEYSDLELCLDSTFIVVERDAVLGFGYYNNYETGLYIDHLYIQRHERLNKLGDSLFRALLNSLFLKGVQFVKMRDDAVYSVFLKAEEIQLIEGEYVIELDEFFNRKCKSEKALKTPLN